MTANDLLRLDRRYIADLTTMGNETTGKLITDFTLKSDNYAVTKIYQCCEYVYSFYLQSLGSKDMLGKLIKNVVEYLLSRSGILRCFGLAHLYVIVVRNMPFMHRM